MSAEWLTQIGAMKQIILVFFTLVFVGVVIHLVVTRSDRYRRAAQIPLDEGRVVDPRNNLSPSSRGASDE